MDSQLKLLKNKVKDHKAVIGIIGLGYVGLPLAIRFSEEGFKTIGFDIDPKKISFLNMGQSYIKHIDDKTISNILKTSFSPSIEFQELTKVDIIIICVPTPLGIHNEPDLSFIHSTLNTIKPFLRENQILILESTTYPGTTEEEVAPVVNSIVLKSKKTVQRFTIGKNFFVGYSPEREDPGNREFTTKTIPKVVSGMTKNCLGLTQLIYNQIINKTVPVSSTKVAEMTKILENIHRAVNIGLVNELKMVANKMDIDIYEVINAAATKPFGFTPYYPGPGLGGHCIPIDPFYLTWKSKELGMNTRFIELAGEINTAMTSYVIQKVGEALNKIERAIKGSKILVLGLSYKKNIDDTRESPSLVIMDSLLKMGANIDFSDPFFSETPKTRKYNFNLKNIFLSAENIKSFDLILLLTDHDDFDYKLIQRNGKLIVDTRGRFKKSSSVIFA